MIRMEKYNIGNTPMIEIPRINESRIFIKAEGENYLGSIKARTGYFLVDSLTKDADNKIIIESTSGNLGYALGFFCKETGRKFIALIDPSIARSKVKRLEDSHIEYMIVEAEKGMDYRSSRIKLAERMTESGDYFWVNQYHNHAGIRAHETTTAPEIWEQTNHQVTHIVCAMGSCGTICGIGNYFHKNGHNVKIIGVEPFGSTIFGTVDCSYINVGAGLVGKPGNLCDCPNAVDKAYVVRDRESIITAKLLWEKYKFNAGVTTGMVYSVAEKIAKEEPGSWIVVISADGRSAYSEYL